MTDAELAYSGGFFDGEGSIFIGGAPDYALQVQMGNSHRGILDWFQYRWGGSIYEHGPDDRHPNARQFWSLVWTSRTTQRVVLEGLLPWLIIKAPEAEIAIKWLDTVGNGRLTEDALATRQRLRDEWKALRVGQPRRERITNTR